MRSFMLTCLAFLGLYLCGASPIQVEPVQAQTYGQAQWGVQQGTSTPNVVIFDGVQNVPIGQLNSTTHTWTTAISGPFSLGSSLTVTGATTLNSTLAVSGTSTLVGNTSVGGTLAVTGATSLGSTLAWGVSGLDPTGATDQAALLTSALSAISSNGGSIHLPCGTYKILSNVSVTYTGHIDFSGSGANCTKLYFQGGSSQGMTFTWGSGTSTLSFHDLAIVTNDTAGSYNGLKLVNHLAAFGSAPDVTQGNRVYNVRIEGNDRTTGAGTMYWGSCLYEEGVSAIDYDNVNCTGKGAGPYSGIGINLNGYVAGTMYSVVHNIWGSNFYRVATGVMYGDYVQGVTINASNFTACNWCVDTIASPTGVLDQLNISSSQFGAAQNGGVRINATGMFDVDINGNEFGSIVIASSEGIRIVGGMRINIRGNKMFGSTAGSTIGIHVMANATEAIVDSNQIGIGSGALATGLQIDNAVHSIIVGPANKITNNTADYNVNASATGVFINDDFQRAVAALPTCTAAIAGSFFHVVNNNTAISYDGGVTTGGAGNQRVACIGGSYHQR